MVLEDDRAVWQIQPWAGTVAQLQQAAERCKQQIEPAAPYPPGYDPAAHEAAYDAEKDHAWQRAEAARRVEITVIEAGGFIRSMSEIGDLAGLSPLDHVRGIDIEIGGNGYIGPSAAINLSKNGLEVRLAGRDRTWTAGLRHELEEILTPIGKMRPLPFEGGVYFGLATFLFYALLVGVGIFLGEGTSWSPVPVVAASFAIAVLVTAPLFTLGAKLPTVELLAPDTRPAWERWRTGAISGALVVVLGIVASLVAGVIDH